MFNVKAVRKACSGWLALYGVGLGLFVACFEIYIHQAARLPLTLAGVVDALGLVLLIGCADAFGARRVAPVIRSTLLMLVAILLCIFYVGTVFYYNVFHDWIHIDIFGQWSVGASVVKDILHTLSPLDSSLGIAAPLLLMLVAGCIPLGRELSKVPRWMPLVLLMCLAVHALTASRNFFPEENNLVMNLMREAVKKLLVRDNSSQSIANNVWEYYPRPAARYRLDKYEQFPLYKEPLVSPSTDSSRAGSPKLNVVLILMESVRAFESGTYGADTSFTPAFDRLATEGVVVKNFYANGSQTVRAEFSLLCSWYPNYTGAPVYMVKPEVHIQSLPSILSAHGYRNLWISGFSSSYANKNQFLLAHGIDEIHDRDSLPQQCKTIGWGPADEEIFAYAETLLDAQRGPFFAEIMTLSNHWPFNHPYTVTPPGADSACGDSYCNYQRGMYYTDWAVGQFIERMRTKPYFNNTLFIITSDHGVWMYPNATELKTVQKQEAYFRMPLLFFAPAHLAPQSLEAIGSQVDVAPTILALLGLDAPNSFVGQSLLGDAPGGKRFALMQHVHQWNLREQNNYVYGVGKECFLEHFPPAKKHAQNNRESQHVLLVCDDDLLRVRNASQLGYGSDSQLQHYRQWVSGLIKRNQYFLFQDRIFPH